MIKSFFAHHHTTRMAVVVLSLNERAAKAMGCSLWPHCRRVDKKKDKSIEKEWKKLLKKSHGMNLFAYLSGCCCSCVLQTKYAAHEMNKSSQPHTHTHETHSDASKFLIWMKRLSILISPTRDEMDDYRWGRWVVWVVCCVAQDTSLWSLMYVLWWSCHISFSLRWVLSFSAPLL